MKVGSNKTSGSNQATTDPKATEKAAGGSIQTRSNKPIGPAFQPTPRQCSQLTLLLIDAKEKEVQKKDPKKKVTRARLTQSTLRRLWFRRRFTPEFLGEVEEWLFRAGWTLFFAGSSFAVIRTDAVEGWMRIATERISDELNEVSRGKYDFGQLEFLLTENESGEQDEDEK